MTHTIARSLVSLASPFLFIIYFWNNIKPLHVDYQHPDLSWPEDFELFIDLN